MKNIILISPPGAGKGTQAQIMSEKYNIPAISFGELLREEARTGSDLGNHIHELQTKGILVEDDICIKVLEKRLKSDDCKNGFILDGYQRSIEQVYLYDSLIEKLNIDFGIVIFLNPPYEEIKKRIVGRVICPNCKEIFNEQIDFLKPQVDGICDNCNSTLVKRSDDNEESYKTRYNVYINQTQPVIDLYKKRNVLYEINDTDMNIVTSKIIDIIEGNND